MQYGVTEVFLKHWKVANLRIKLVRKTPDGLISCQYLGDRVADIEKIEFNGRIYPIPENFFLIDLPDEYGYIYQSGEYSFYRYKYIKHVGSSRSSKSWSLEEAAIRKCEENNGTRLTIWRDTRTSLGETIWKDFKKVFPLSGRSYKFTQDTRPIYFKNGSTIEPHGDDTTNAHGLTQDIAWLNEPYKMSDKTFDQIDQRADQIWIDINPKQGHWSDKLDQNPRCIVIHSTFDKNPFCPIEQRLKILSYDPSNPINVLNKTANEYNWQVYGLGMKAEKPNRIFRFKKISRAEYDKIEARKIYYSDWGKVDPWAIGECKYQDGALYVRELNYLSENQIREKELSDAQKVELHDTDGSGRGIVEYKFKQLGISHKSTIIADSNRPLKIAALRRIGYEDVIPAHKPKDSIDTGISILQSIDVYYTDDSPNIEYEQENWSYVVDRYGVTTEDTEDTDNHHMDGIRYVGMHLFGLGLIRTI